MSLPAHLFVSSDGALYDMRDANWNKRPPVRRYYTSPRGAEGPKGWTLTDVKAALRAGPYTDVGGYPLYFVTRDGAALSFEAAREQFRQVAWDFLKDASTGWRIDGLEINYEDFDLRCDHTGARIPAAYEDDDGQPDELQEWEDYDPDC